MVMEKKLNLMGNSQLFNLWFLLCCLVLTSCGRTQIKETNNADYVKKESSLDNDFKEITFLPDSTVNNILILNNVESSKKFYSAIYSKKVINFLRESPVIGFTNKEASEYLLLYQYEGGIENAFSCFEIGDTTSVENELTTTNYNNFKTESGIMLGMSLDDLIRIKGKSYKKQKNKITYQITDYSSSDFLKKYNMPAYFFECTFDEKKIVKIKYGFDYP